MSPIVCIIPARGGSKGIPRKNLAVVAGKPLLAWSIEQALAVPDLAVYVSTEDPEIAEVARRYGASVIDRPEQLARDATASEPVIEHALSVLSDRNERPDIVMFLQATSPVRLPGTLQRAIELLHESGGDTVVSVIAESPFLWRKGSSAVPEYDVARRPRRQDMAVADLRYRENGSIYVTRTWVYEELHNRIGGRVELLVLDPIEALDVDTPADLAVAHERLLRLEG